MSKRKIDQPMSNARVAKQKKGAPAVTKASTSSKATAGKRANEKAPKEDLVVFAFRLTEAERDLIHKAAGPAKASQYVRTLAVAAARGDEAGIKEVLHRSKPAA